MKRTLRIGMLAAAIAATSWLAQPQAGEASYSCSSMPRSCEIGSTTTCSTGDEIRRCECVSINGNGRWLCFYN